MNHVKSLCHHGITKVWNSTIAGFLQLAGGTNAHTVHAMRTHGFCEETLGNTSFSQGFLLEWNYHLACVLWFMVPHSEFSCCHISIIQDVNAENTLNLVAEVKSSWNVVTAPDFQNLFSVLRICILPQHSHPLDGYMKNVHWWRFMWLA
mgnify:CR=1 FL=1